MNTRIGAKCHMSKQYDLIGDIHGHANDLIELLRLLGYSESSGYYQHPTRNVIFLGDFVDRGKNQRRVLEIVMPMVESGTAYAVMGNHEYNALAFHTKDPENSDVWLRSRSTKNIYQHMAFLEEYSAPSCGEDLDRVLSFFRSLPLWLELDGLRVVHACWDKDLIEKVRPLLGENNTLTESLLIASTRKGGLEYDAIETLLKGAEMTLPNGECFFDKDGNRRTEARVRWWLNEASSWGFGVWA